MFYLIHKLAYQVINNTYHFIIIIIILLLLLLFYFIIIESIRSLCYNHSPVVSSYAIATCINTYISDERVNNEFIEQIIQLLLIVGNRNTKVIKVSRRYCSFLTTTPIVN